MLGDLFTERELELYGKYNDFIRRKIAAETRPELNLKWNRVNIESIHKNGENYGVEWSYGKSGIFKIEVISYDNWRKMWMRSERLKNLIG